MGAGKPDHAMLADEARWLASEIIRMKRTLTAGGRCDLAMVGQLSRCHDRLDDIADVIGPLTVQRIYAEANGLKAEWG